MVSGLRISLRRYVLWSLLSLATIIIVLFSIQSSDSFFDGMDGMLRNTMIRAGKTVQLNNELETEILDLHIYARYQDMPSDIKHVFPQERFTPFVLLKDINKSSWFGRPTSAYFALLVPLKNGEARYVTQMFRAPPKNEDKRWRITHTIYRLMIGVITLLSFALALLFLMRSVSRPVESLQQWAATLDEKKLDEPIPEFRYKELNALAQIIHGSLQDVRNTLNRERTFVNHASHELRTPIAVIRSSASLLHRVMDADNTKGNNAIMRIDNASKTMTDLTETLLWLGRDDNSVLPVEETNVKTIVKNLSDDLTYLLAGKDVEVKLNLDDCTLALPKTVSEIAIGNVIRNAYQHTQYGEVNITLTNHILTVVNAEKSVDALTTHTPSSLDVGFGIGLKLIEKLCLKLGWVYSHELLGKGEGCRVSLHFQQQSLLDSAD